MAVNIRITSSSYYCTNDSYLDDQSGMVYPVFVLGLLLYVVYVAHGSVSSGVARTSFFEVSRASGEMR